MHSLQQWLAHEHQSGVTFSQLAHEQWLAHEHLSGV